MTAGAQLRRLVRWAYPMADASTVEAIARRLEGAQRKEVSDGTVHRDGVGFAVVDSTLKPELAAADGWGRGYAVIEGAPPRHRRGRYAAQHERIAQ